MVLELNWVTSRTMAIVRILANPLYLAGTTPSSARLTNRYQEAPFIVTRNTVNFTRSLAGLLHDWRSRGAIWGYRVTLIGWARLERGGRCANQRPHSVLP